MPVKVKETPFDQPDVSRVTPVYVPPNSTRSYPVKFTYMDENKRYRHCIAFWDDVDKVWRYESSGYEVQYREAVKSEPIAETEKHYED